MRDAEFELECNETVRKWREERERQVRELAYQKWQGAGEPQGDGLQFWLDAEREVDRRDFWLPSVHCEENVCCNCEDLPGAEDLSVEESLENPTDPRLEDQKGFWARWFHRGSGE